MDKEQSDHHMNQHHFLTPEQLRIGHYIHLDLGWMDHPFTFGNFKIKDEEQIRKIQGLNLQKIRFDPKRSDVVADPPKATRAVEMPIEVPPKPTTFQKPRLRSDRLKQLNEALIESERIFSHHATIVREAVRNLSDHPERSKAVAENLVAEMVNSVMTESDVVLHVISGSRAEQAHIVHPMNVAVLALMMAKSLDMQEVEASELGLAAVFHDVGKEDRQERKSFLDMHCEMGARIASRAGLSERISTIIHQHHEYMDGSGLPMRLKGDKIDPLSRVLALVNHFDNLCNPPNAAEALTPYEALSQMYALHAQKFDTTVLRLLVRTLGVYPPGSVVQLSNEMYGLVLTVNPHKPLLPLVMIYVPEVARETPVVIDLAEEVEITIRKCLRPAQLTREAFDYLKPGKRVYYYFLKNVAAYGPEGDAKAAPVVDEVQRDTPVRMSRT